MRTLCKVCLVLLAVALIASPALAQGQGRPQGPGGFGGATPAMLLGQQAVQAELKLTDDQLAKVKDFQAKQGEIMRGLRDLGQEERRAKMQEIGKQSEKAVADILNADQGKRLKQIGYQVRGSGAFGEAEVATALNITDEQKEKIKAIQEDSRKAMAELFTGGGGKPPSEEARQKIAEFRKSTDGKLLNVLTEAQKGKWKELIGQPFDTTKLQFGRPGGKPPTA